MKMSALVIVTLSLICFAAGVAGVARPHVPEEVLHRQVTVYTEPEQMKIRKIEDFDWITLPECSHISIQGHPALPMRSVMIRLPRNTELIEIDLLGTSSISIPGRYLVAPAPKPNVIGHKTENEIADVGTKFEDSDGNSPFSEPLHEIYNSSMLYPSKLFDYYSSKGREYNYVIIYLYPVEFVPSEGRLTLVNQATFDVGYRVDGESAKPLDTPSLDEVIITTPAYETEANTLSAWRNATGVRTAVFEVDWIYDNYGGVDETQKIRNFIGDMFNNTGIRYALLLGDVDDVPTRFAYVPDGGEDPPDGIEVPTDYYYECLEGTWDPNGDGKYADLQEDNYAEIDFIPEISVGRLSVDEATASHVVEKTIQYEKNFDPTWFNKMILAGTDPFTGAGAVGAEGEILKDYVQDAVQYNFTTFTKLYETEGNLSASTISESINTGSGAANFAGHGHYALWSLGTGGTYTNDDAASLTNGYKLPVVAAMACLTAGFDSMYNPGNCIGEEFLRNPNGGTSAYVGSTRNAWGYGGTAITEGLAGELDWRFWESYKLGIIQPGPMLSEAKVRYIASHPLNIANDGYYLDEKTVLEFVLLGDPALFLIPHNVVVKAYKDSTYSEETKFFTVDDTVYIEASVTAPGGENISDANVFAELYTDSSLEMSIPLTHLGGNSSLYRGSYHPNSSSTVGVYSVNASAISPQGSINGENQFHLYSNCGVSAYQLDWDEDENDDYVLESEHLISVFDGVEYTHQPIIYLYQKDTATAYTFGQIGDPDSIGKGEITTSNVEGIEFSLFSPQTGENLTSSYLEAKVNITIQTDPQKTKILIIGDDGNTESADLFNTMLATAGYTVTQELASVTNRATWTDYDILVWAASDDTSPIHNGNPTIINGLVTYTNGGGRLIIEGGEIGYQAANNNWNAFMSDVLHIYDQWFGDWPDRYAELTVEAPTHPVRTIPNMLPDPILFTFGSGADYGTADWLATTDGKVIYQWNEYVSGESANYGEPLFGVMAYDNDDDTTNGGQIVFLSFDICDVDSPTDETDLIENMAKWLTPQVTTSFNLTVTMRNGPVDYLVYRLHNFDQNISNISDIFSDITGTHGLSVSDDRYHLEDGTDGLITSLTVEQWNNHAVNDYVCIYDNSTSADPTHNTVIAWVRFNETQTVAYQDVGLWNDADYHTEGLRIRYNVSQTMTTDEVSYLLVFTEGNWKTIDQWITTIESGLYPDPNFNRLIDVAVVSVEPSPTEVYAGQVVNITVTAKNEGTTTETFNVTTYYDTNIIGTQTVTSLAPDVAMNLTFSWNTTDVAPCVNYTIRAEASVVANEADIINNNFTDGYVKVKMLGDINGDGVIDILDLNAAGKTYGSYVGDPRYDPEADLNKDGHVDMRDLAVIGRNYGKTY